ncbi:unnamed protein product [Mucor hiemalis]
MMSNTINHHDNGSNSMKRSKKPKPLFGIFRKNRPDPVVVVPSTSSPISLGSGVSSVPLGSILTTSNYKQDPYAPPRLPKTVISDPRNPLLSPQFTTTTTTNRQQQYQRRPRSKSVGRDPSSSHIRLMEERESALNKLCQREMNSPTSSLVDSLPLLSPTYSPPPVPPIPLRHQQQQQQPQQQPQSPRSPQKPTMRKFSSAHDLRKAGKLQQESIQQATIKPLPSPITTKKKDLSRSKSLNNGQQSPRKLHASKSQQHLLMPTTPNVMALSRPRWPPIMNRDDDDDDDIPLGYLQSPVSRPSSLLSDEEEEDDKDLVPIAALESIDSPVDYQTAADKYKEKVKERLQLDDDDDDIPISLLSCVKK